MSDGKTPGGEPLGTLGYLNCVLTILLVWALFTGIVLEAHWLRTFRSAKWCRILAGLLCLFVPFGTILGGLTFIYVGTWSAKPPAT